MSNTITNRQKELLVIIYRFIKNSGFPPSFEEMRSQLKVSSNQSVVDLLKKLENKKLIKRNESSARGIKILPLGYKVLEEKPLVPFLGVSHAGVPTQSMEIAGEWRTLSSEVAQLNSEVFLLKIAGDSMINAGIDDGDYVLIKSDKEFVSGDIVLAQIGSESTVKRFISEDKPPYLYLKPENPSHNIINITEEVILKGKAISVLKKGEWQSLS